jgi:hypothetical protein
VSSDLPGHGRRVGRLGVLLLLLLGGLPRAGQAQLVSAREYEVKAGFVFNFALFVEWPDGAFATPTERLRLQVIGHDPFDGALDRLVAGKTVRGHPIEIVYSNDVAGVARAHIVFVSASKREQLPGVLAGLTRSPTLTISDIDRFAHQGGVIGLVSSGQQIRFVVNRAAAARARLTVSSRLLSLATVLDQDAVAPVAPPTR